MRRIPALLPVPAFAAALVLAVTGCASGGNRSTQAEQAMYAAVSKPVTVTTAPPASREWGGPADGLRMAVPKKWVTVAPADRARALDAVGLGPLRPAVLQSVLPGWDSPGSVTLADPRPGGGAALAVMSLSCAATHLPPGTNALTGLNMVAEQEFAAVNSSNAQLGQTTVDGHTAVLVYNQMSVGPASVTALQYAIAAPGGRTCYVTLATQKQVRFMRAFSRLRPAIQVLDS